MISIRTWLVLAIALAACELEPPPKPAPAAPAAAATTPAPAPTPPPAPTPRPAAPAPVPVQPRNPECLAAGVHFADVTIAEAKGATRAQLEHDRTLIVKQTEDACVAQHWSESAIQCFVHAGTAAALHVCDRQLAQPTNPGAGHAAPAAGNEAAGSGHHEAAGSGHHDPVIEGHAGSGSSHTHRTRTHDSHATHTHGSR